MTPKSKRTGLVAVLAVALVVITALGVVAAGCGSSELPSAGGSTATTAASTGTSGGASAASLNGAGATFPKPLYIEWIGEFQAANPGVKINYQGIGSGGGIEQFTKLTVDFGASDAPMKDEEITAAETASGAKVLHIPTVFGSVVLAYNLPDVEGTEARLRHPGRHLPGRDHQLERSQDRRSQLRHDPARQGHPGRPPLRLLRHHEHLHRAT